MTHEYPFDPKIPQPELEGIIDAFCVAAQTFRGFQKRVSVFLAAVHTWLTSPMGHSLRSLDLVGLINRRPLLPREEEKERDSTRFPVDPYVYFPSRFLPFYLPFRLFLYSSEATISGIRFCDALSRVARARAEDRGLTGDTVTWFD